MWPPWPLSQHSSVLWRQHTVAHLPRCSASWHRSQHAAKLSVLAGSGSRSLYRRKMPERRIGHSAAPGAAARAASKQPTAARSMGCIRLW